MDCFFDFFFFFFFFVSFHRMQVDAALASKLLTRMHVSIRGNVSTAPGLQIYCLASRGYQSFLMTSETRRKTIVRSKYTYCFVPFPTDADCYGLFFGRVVGFFWFLSVTLDMTELQFSIIQVILPSKKKKSH